MKKKRKNLHKVGKSRSFRNNYNDNKRTDDGNNIRITV